MRTTRLAAAVVCLMSGWVAGQTTRPALPVTTQPVRLAVSQPAIAPATQPSGGPQTQSAITQHPTTFPSFPPVDEVLQQLGSDDWHVRRKAQDLLVSGGEDAKPFIEELIRHAATDEARKNAQAALAQIDQNRQLGPSFI